MTTIYPADRNGNASCSTCGVAVYVHDWTSNRPDTCAAGATTTRHALRAATADLADHSHIHDAALAAFVSTAHDDDADDTAAAAAAQQFVDSWHRHPVQRKSARYGLALHALRNRPENADRVVEFDEMIRRTHGESFDEWHHHYRASLDEHAAAR